MTEQPFVSVIIPHFNDLKGLAMCLATLERQTYPRNRFEIIVGDNASPVGEAEVAKTIADHTIAGGARLVVVHDRGAGPARNGAVALATGEILAFIDSDCKAYPDWIAEGIAALPAYDFIGGHVEVGVDDPAHMSPIEAFECVFAFDFKDYIERKGFTGAGNMFVSRRVFDAVGGFGVVFSEDREWSLRATGMGYRLGYAPKAVVIHPARRAWSDLTAKWRRLNSETFALTATTPVGRLKWLVKTAALPASAVAHTPKVLAHRRLTSLSAKMDALRTLYRLRFWRIGDALGVFMRALRS